MIAVWVVDLDAPEWLAESYVALLESGEHARVARFVSRRDATRWQASRCALRLLLAEAVGGDAGSLRIDQAPGVAPRLPDHPNTAFSVSHSAQIALIAVGGSVALGVDVERLRVMQDLTALSDRCFTAREREALGSLGTDAPDASAAFLRHWTRKEALLKALGMGVHSMQKVEVLTSAQSPPLAFIGRADGGADWAVLDVTPAEGYVGAVASAAADPSVVVRRFLPPTASRP